MERAHSETRKKTGGIIKWILHTQVENVVIGINKNDISEEQKSLDWPWKILNRTVTEMLQANQVMPVLIDSEVFS